MMLRHLYTLHLLDFAVYGHEYYTGAHTGKGFENEFDLFKGEWEGAIGRALRVCSELDVVLSFVFNLLATGHKHNAFALQMRFDEAPKYV